MSIYIIQKTCKAERNMMIYIMNKLGITQQEIGKNYGISQKAVSYICQAEMKKYETAFPNIYKKRVSVYKKGTEGRVYK